MKKTIAFAAMATAAVAFGAGVSAASATDYIYWAGFDQSSSIGRANLDGTGVNENFVSSAGDSARTVMVNSSNVFWTSGMNAPLDIKKVNLDGSGVATVGQTAPGAAPSQVTLQGSYIYFPALQGKIGRIGIDGTGYTATFSSAVFPGQGNANFTGLASDASYLYAAGPNPPSVIGRVNIAGTLDNENFITGISPVLGDIAPADGYIYWATETGIGRAKSDGTARQNTFVTGLTGGTGAIAVGGGYIYWASGNGSSFTPPYAIARMKADGTDLNPNFITGLTRQPWSLAITPGAGGATPTPTPAPPPTPTPAPGFAIAKATPTVNASAPGENAVVTVNLQLEQKGRYTFIFETSTSSEMSREQATSKRVPMQKGSRIGKRLLKKRVTAAVITTTEDNARLVTRALLRKAQAKHLNLRVIYAPAGTAQGESVIKIN